MFDLNNIWMNPDLQGIGRRMRTRVDSSNGPDACWPWLGSLKPNGYGQIVAHCEGAQQTVYPHRAAYIMANGPIPKLINGQVASVLHRCDNPACCNPKHLFLGNARMNMDDKVSKNRQPRGEDNGFVKLSEKEVIAIRASTETCVVLARRYAVSPMAISKVRTRSTWKHLERAVTDA